MKGVELYGRVRYAVQIEGLSHREADGGIVTLVSERCNQAAYRMSSGGRNRRAPCVHRRGTKASVGP